MKMIIDGDKVKVREEEKLIDNRVNEFYGCKIYIYMCIVWPS